MTTEKKIERLQDLLLKVAKKTIPIKDIWATRLEINQYGGMKCVA